MPEISPQKLLSPAMASQIGVERSGSLYTAIFVGSTAFLMYVPSYIDKLFITNQSIHSRQTRHGGYNLVYHRYTRSSEVGRSFTISSIKLWNSLPPEIKRKQSIGSFKNALRKHFIGTYANIDSFSVNM
jgi:hypothetical protein